MYFYDTGGHLCVAHPDGRRDPATGVRQAHRCRGAARLSARLRLPSKRFYRHIGLYADMPFDADVATLQKAVREPAQITNWIARPARGI